MDYNYYISFIITGKIILSVILPLIISALFITYLMLFDNKLVNSIIEMIINIPIIFPPIGLGFLLVLCFSKNGYFGGIFNVDIVFSFAGICIAAYLTGIPFVARAIMAGSNTNIRQLCNASYTLGRGRLNTFIQIVIPLLRNSIIQGLILAVGRIIGEVGITLMVGGNIDGKTTTVSLDIYNAVLDGENEKALLLAGVLLLFSLIMFYILRKLGSKVYSID